MTPRSSTAAPPPALDLWHGEAHGGALHWAACSDVGPRDHNEDGLLLAPELDLFAVADGMGGHAAGEVASAMAIELVREAVRENQRALDGLEDRERVLRDAVRKANLYVHEDGRGDPAHRGMGTTLTVCSLVWPACVIAQVGDSRAYRIRAGRVEQVTRDHDLLEDARARGLSEADIRAMQVPRNVITNAIGIKDKLRVDTYVLALRPRDLVVLCSDGLYEALDDDAALFAGCAGRSPADAVRKLMEKALPKAGDNVSVIVLEVAS